VANFFPKACAESLRENFFKTFTNANFTHKQNYSFIIIKRQLFFLANFFIQMSRNYDKFPQNPIFAALKKVDSKTNFLSLAGYAY
jgi:hypothetical protein